MISHDLAAARYLATRLAVMYAGKLVETGDCEAVYAEPLHPYTEALLSAALPLHPSARRQRIVLGGEVPNPARPPAGLPLPPALPEGVRRSARAGSRTWREVQARPLHRLSSVLSAGRPPGTFVRADADPPLAPGSVQLWLADKCP